MVTLKRFVLLNCSLIMGLCSCAYHVGDSRTPNEILRAYVPVLENITVRPLDLNELTSHFRESLEPIKGVIVVSDKKDADIVILGRVTRYDRTWGPTAYKGTEMTANSGGLKKDALSASTARVYLEMQIEKRSPLGELMWSSTFVESDLYELSDRLELARGSAASPALHASREALLVTKLANRIFERAQSQLVDDF